MRPERSVGGLALGAIAGIVIANLIAPDARAAAALATTLPIAAMLLAGVHAALAVWIGCRAPQGRLRREHRADRRHGRSCTFRARADHARAKRASSPSSMIACRARPPRSASSAGWRQYR
jgi:hypothetical protein